MNSNQDIEKDTKLINKVAHEFYDLDEVIFILINICTDNLINTDEGQLLSSILLNNVIISLGRLIDQTDKSISIVLLLKKNYKKYSHNEESPLELSILEQMGFKFPFELKDKALEGSFINNITVFRNKFGRAHLDELMVLDSIKENENYSKHKFSLDDVRQFLHILEKALELLFERANLPLKDSLIINDRSRAVKFIDRFR